MSGKWKVRKGYDSYGFPWRVYTPTGDFSSGYRTHSEALAYAVSIAARVEYWLEHQR